jgi:response regulator RpfG family c-di-GMP phosphodiesterase
MAKVLVVDDEKALRATLTEFLREGGHEVDAAEGAGAAETLLQSKGFDVVLSDLILPDLNGDALLAKIKAAAPRAQVILMTGEPAADTAAASLRDGAADYLSKPCTKEVVLRAVSRACRIKSLSDEKERLEAENRRYQENLEELVVERTAALREREQHLNTMMDGSIKAIASAGAFHDPHTAGHERRVAHLAVAIAQRLGIAQPQLHGIEIAGFLHDIGKIAVPTEILSKPGRLNPLEFGMVKMHPQVGYEILRKINFLWPVAEATLQHHERLDGSGYPSGIKDAEIITEARILAVADAVEAMSSRRPYRPAMGVEVALKEIRKQGGKLFDRSAVDACVEVVESAGFHLDSQRHSTAFQKSR